MATLARRVAAIALVGAALALAAGAGRASAVTFPPLPPHTTWCGTADGTDPNWAAIPCVTGTGWEYIECADGTVWTSDPLWASSGSLGTAYPACRSFLILMPGGSTPGPAPPTWNTHPTVGQHWGNGTFIGWTSPLFGPDPGYVGELRCVDATVWAVPVNVNPSTVCPGSAARTTLGAPAGPPHVLLLGAGFGTAGR